MNKDITLKDKDIIVYKLASGEEDWCTLGGKDWNGEPITALEKFNSYTEGEFTKVLRIKDYEVIYEKEAAADEMEEMKNE